MFVTSALVPYCRFDVTFAFLTYTALVHRLDVQVGITMTRSYPFPSCLLQPSLLLLNSVLHHLNTKVSSNFPTNQAKQNNSRTMFLLLSCDVTEPAASLCCVYKLNLLAELYPFDIANTLENDPLIKVRSIKSFEYHFSLINKRTSLTFEHCQ